MCVWNEANALRTQHGLPLKDLHISLAPKGSEPGPGLHSLSLLRPTSPFQLDERKLIQVGLSPPPQSYELALSLVSLRSCRWAWHHLLTASLPYVTMCHDACLSLMCGYALSGVCC